MDELSRLQEVGRTLVTSLDVEKTIESALNAVVQLLGFDRAWLVQVDQERQVGERSCRWGYRARCVFSPTLAKTSD